LINPDNTLRCDCGYDFSEGIIKQSHLQEAESQKAASKFQELVDMHGSVDAALKAIGKRNMLRGAAWLIGGSLLTGLSYVVAAKDASETGQGVYVILIGAFVIGIVQFARGLIQYFG